MAGFDDVARRLLSARAIMRLVLLPLATAILAGPVRAAPSHPAPAHPAAPHPAPGHPAIEVVEHWSEVEREQRTFTGITMIGTGVVTAGLGAYVMSRDGSSRDDVGRDRQAWGWASLGFGTAFALGGAVALLAARGEHEELAKEIRLGATPGDVERRWGELADRARRWRHIGGGFALAAGGIFLGAGGYFAFRRGDDARADAMPSTILLAMGLLYTTVGAMTLTFRQPIETSYETYVRTRNGAGPSALSIVPVVSPIDRGAAFGLAGAF